MSQQKAHNTIIILQEHPAADALAAASPVLDYEACKEAGEVLRALNHEVRQSILQVLRAHGPLNIRDTALQLRIDPGLITPHIKALRSTGLLRAVRNRKGTGYLPDEGRLTIVAEGVNIIVAGLADAARHNARLVRRKRRK